MLFCSGSLRALPSNPVWRKVLTRKARRESDGPYESSQCDISNSTHNQVEMSRTPRIWSCDEAATNQVRPFLGIEKHGRPF